MAGVSTGVSLLQVSTPSVVFRFIDYPDGIFSIAQNQISVSGFSDYAVEVIGDTVVSHSLQFNPDEGTDGVNPTYTFSNAPSSLTNRITFSLSSSNTISARGSYTILVATAGGRYISASANYVLSANYHYMSTSYPTSPYTVAGSPISISTTSPDSFGFNVNTNGTYGKRLSIINPNPPYSTVTELSSTVLYGYLYLYLANSFMGTLSKSVRINIPDSANIRGNYGADLPVSLSRTPAWLAASTNVNATFPSTGFNHYLTVTFDVAYGRVIWFANNSISTTGLVNGWWVSENGGDCKLPDFSNLDCKFMYTPVSGSNNWSITKGSGSGFGVKGVLLSNEFSVVRLDANVAGLTDTSVIKVSFYTSTNALLYEQNITLTVSK